MVARNREQLIHVAARLFLSKGYKYTSIEDVVQKSGVSRSNLYFHFKSKEELLFAVVDFWGNRYESALEISLGQHQLSAQQRIEAFIDLLLDEVSARGERGTCPFIAMYQQSAVEASEVHQRIKKFFTCLEQLIGSLIAQGMETGEFRAAIGEKQAAILFVSALEGSLVLAEMKGDLSIVISSAEAFFTMLR